MENPAALGPGLRQIHADAQRLLSVINELVHADAGQIDLERLSAELSGPLRSVMTGAEALRLQAQRAGGQQASQDLERIALAANALQSVITNGVVTPTEQSTTGTVAIVAAAGAPAEAGVILVVDDNSANREMLGRRLEREGHQVQLAAGGREALDLLQARRVDLVLLDVMMSDLDGYAVLQQLKADAKLRDIPVLMISAVDEIGSVVRCIELGAEDYLPKPFDPVLLRARIGACLEKKRLRDRDVEHLQALAEWSKTLEHRVAEQVALVERLGRLSGFSPLSSRN